MNIIEYKNGNELTLALQGRLDTSTAPILEAKLAECIQDIDSLVLDLKDLEYISSAGLRVLLSAHKRIGVKGGMKVVNVNEIIMEIFEITRFKDILTIE